MYSTPAFVCTSPWFELIYSTPSRLGNFRHSVMAAVGTDRNAIGCEICKPTTGSMLPSLYVVSAYFPLPITSSVVEELLQFTLEFFGYSYNEPVMKPEHHQNRDTNHRFMANIQQNGMFGIVPCIAAGEITPEGLIAIRQVVTFSSLSAGAFCIQFEVQGAWGVVCLLNCDIHEINHGSDTFIL